MTHYEVSYAGLTERQADAKALTDVREYLGEAKFESISRMLRENWGGEVPTEDRFALVVAFAGVVGRPVTAWHRYLWSERKTK